MLYRKLRHPERTAGEVDEELRLHVEMRAADLERGGMGATEARRRARMEFGSQERFAEECRESLPARSWDALRQDVRYSVRVLSKSPGFAVVAVLTIALAVGANAAAFAALNAIILRPLEVPRAESLYSIHQAKNNSGAFSYPAYRDFQARNSSFEDLAAYSVLQAGLEHDGATTRDWVLATSGNYFDVLGIQPEVGRFYHASDEKGANSAPYVVLAHAYWRNRFAADPGVVGRSVRLNRQPYTILGVAPPDFTGTLLFFEPDYYVPVVNIEDLDSAASLTNRGLRWLFTAFGHLKESVSAEAAAAELNAIQAELAKTYPKDHAAVSYKLARPSLYGEFLGGPARGFMAALTLLAALILVAACANLGSLFAARAADRNRELALRIALGAGRARVLRQLFTESTLIALAGGALGLYGSVLLLEALRAWRPLPQFPVHIPIEPDASVYAVALGLSIVSGFLFGAAPLRQILRTDPHEAIKAGARSTAERHWAFRDLLVAAQIAICALLVTASFVAVRGLVRSFESDFGFNPRNVLLAETVMNMAGYRGEAMKAAQKRMVESVRSLPDVKEAGLIEWVPLSNGSLHTISVHRYDAVEQTPATAIFTAGMYRISPGYLGAAQTRILQGRDFGEHDDEKSPRVAIINREFAVRLFGSPEKALDGQFKLRQAAAYRVVGVVEDGKYQSLTETRQAVVFLPLEQNPASETNLVVRPKGGGEGLAEAIRARVQEVDPALPVFIHTWESALNLVFFPARAAAFALGILGAIGALLSLTGIFGIAAYSVSRRMKELGIRMALGAKRREVLEAALGRSLRLLIFGSAAGLVLGLLASQVLGAIVYQATPRDPVVMAAVVGVMLLLGILATWIPARRALALDPLVLLRDE
jgi:predicted permease